jgi:hypothetical protein
MMKRSNNVTKPLVEIIFDKTHNVSFKLRPRKLQCMP